MKRIQHEDVSKYKNNIELDSRYLLLNLLGKGGFSEVYKAYDFDEQMMVAIKIHQLNQDWTEQKKADYQRHARREAEIQKSINHCKIVRLYDRFEVDINT
jgi:tousled-like kinase